MHPYPMQFQIAPPVFHVSCLKPELGQHNPIPTLPPVDKEGDLSTELIAILQRRMIKLGKEAAIEVLVQWQGVSKEDDT